MLSAPRNVKDLEDRRTAGNANHCAKRLGHQTSPLEKRRRLKLEAQSAVGVPDLEAFSAHGLARPRQQLEGTIFGLRQAKNCTRALRLALENEKPDDRWGLRKRQNPKTKKRSSGRPLPTYRPKCSGLTGWGLSMVMDRI